MADPDTAVTADPNDALELTCSNRYKGTRTKFTPALRLQFLENLRKTGNPSQSADLCGITLNPVGYLRTKDPEFAQLYDFCLGCYAESLREAAHRRAVEGVQKPVFGGRFKDEIVGHITEYSDSLLQTLLKGAFPEYRGEKDKQEDRPNGLVLVPVPSFESPEAYEAFYERTVAAPQEEHRKKGY